VDTKLGSQFVFVTAVVACPTIAAADFGHLIVSQLRLTVPLTPSVTVLTYRVLPVVGVCTEEQVTGANTSRVITVVADVYA
jgi:hypothetical protein